MIIFYNFLSLNSLIKMLYWLVETGDTPYQLTSGQFKHAVLRNFGGTDDFNPVNSFQTCFDKHVSDPEVCINNMSNKVHHYSRPLLLCLHANAVKLAKCPYWHPWSTLRGLILV